MHIVDIPISISVKWEPDPQCPPSDISTATHTGNNEFELDGLPLGQVGVCGDGKFCKIGKVGEVRVKEE